MIKNKGFTLIELLVVISIIGFIATLSMVTLKNAREKARDARRLADMKQIQTALDLYYDYNSNNYFPPISSDACCDGWDQGPCDGEQTFIGELVTAGLMRATPVDPAGGTGTGCYGYAYYRYGAGSYGCDVNRGAFYILGVRNMETSSGAYPSSPGWSCPGRNWQTEFEWVIGKFER